jgi:thioesterase domain-containing protein
VFDLGADSLSVEELLARVRDTFGVEVDVRAVIGGPSVEALAAHLRRPAAPAASAGRSSSRARSRLVVPIPTGPDRPGGAPVVLLGGGDDPALSMLRLGRRLADRHRVAIVRPPEVDGHPRPYRTIAAYGAALHEELRAAGFVGSEPVVVAGHSFGGLVAYEAARRRAEAGLPVAAVVLVDTMFPRGRFAAWRRLLRDRRRGAAVAGVSAVPASAGSSDAGEPVQAGTDRTTVPARLSGVAGAVRRRARFTLHQVAGVGRPTADDDAYAHTLAMRLAGSRYRPGPYAGRVILLRASRGPTAQRWGLARDLGWGTLTPQVEVVVVEGFHAGLVQEPYVGGVAAAIEAALEQGPGRGAGRA